MVNYVVAVSGGVDSVVLLDMFAKGNIPHAKLVIAHFDHGIRDESADDAMFVHDLAKKYELPFETKREDLGKDTSEELARNRRYTFLRYVAKKHNAKIVTAHHADDVVETITINLTRGTGWRGLAVLDSADIERPLLNKRKSEIIEYARMNSLEWREDATNSDTKYLRNDIRKKLTDLDIETHQLLCSYRDRQVALRKEIDAEARRLIEGSSYSRYFFICSPIVAAEELLRAAIIYQVDYRPTRPQVRRALHAIKTFYPQKIYEIASGVYLKFTVTHFSVEK